MAFKLVSIDEALEFLKGDDDSHDYLGLRDCQALLEQFARTSARLGAETVQFSDSVLKLNKKGKTQDRELVITNAAIYSFKPEQYRKPEWRVDFSTLSGIFLSSEAGEVLLRVLHLPDFLFHVVRLDELVHVLQDVYESVCSVKLKVSTSKKLPLAEIADFNHKRPATIGGLLAQPAHRRPLAATAAKASKLLGIGYEGRPSSAHTPHVVKANVFEGWLAKQQEGTDNWKRRWFVLYKQTMTYYSPRTTSQTTLTEGIVRSVSPEEPSDLVDVLDNPQLCTPFLHYLKSKTCSLDEVLCYLDIKAFERAHSGSDEQLKFARLILDRYLLDGADHEIEVDSQNVRAVEQIVKSGKTRSDSLKFIKNCVLNKLDKEAFPAYKKISQEKRSSLTLSNADSRASLLPDVETPTGLHAFTYEPIRGGRKIIFAAEEEISAMHWVHTLEDVMLDMRVGRPCEKHQIEGWLHELKPDQKWYRSYCTLQGDKLWQFAMKYKGSISLSGGKVQSVHVDFETAGSATPTISVVEANYAGFTTRTRFAFRFNVTTRKGKMACLAADSHDILLDWMRETSMRTDLAGTMNVLAPISGLRMGSKTLKAMGQEAPKGDVAIVFTDVQSSTALWESVPAEMSAALMSHDVTLRDALTRYNGYEVKTEGDAFMVAFSNPLDAIQWCITSQVELLKVKWPQALVEHTAAGEVKSFKETGRLVFRGIRVRMGIHYGQPKCRENPITHRMDYYGKPVNKSSRVADSAHGGQIVCTAAVREYLSAHPDALAAANHAFSCVELGEFPLRGIREKVTVHQVTPDGPLSERVFGKLRIHPARVDDLRAAAGDSDAESVASNCSFNSNAPPPFG